MEVRLMVNMQASQKVFNDNAAEWAPVDFSYPAINPCPYELSEMKPIPYRPFRWGQYQ